MSSIALYTAVTANKDEEVVQDFPVIRFIDAYDMFKDPRRNSRMHKIMPHKYFKADYSIYMDGNMKLLKNPEELIERYMQDYDLALFKHGARDCIYDEAIAVAKLGLDDPELIIEQASHYEQNEYGRHKGLLQGGFIIRRHNARVEAFNEAWWADYCRYSRRDQLSLMPAIDKSGVIVNMIDEKWQEHDGVATIGGIIEMRHHANFSGNFNEKK